MCNIHTVLEDSPTLIFFDSEEQAADAKILLESQGQMWLDEVAMRISFFYCVLKLNITPMYIFTSLHPARWRPRASTCR